MRRGARLLVVMMLAGAWSQAGLAFRLPWPITKPSPKLKVESPKLKAEAITDQSLVKLDRESLKKQFIMQNKLSADDLKPSRLPNHYIVGRRRDKLKSAGASLQSLHHYQATLTPNDPRYSQQPHLTQIGMPSAWDTTTGSTSVVIAVIDTGFALSHQDLSAQWWTNPGETGSTASEGAAPNCTSRSLALDKSCNNLDDDGDGLKDDWRGWDYMNSDNDPVAGSVNSSGGGVDHGTMTAGLAAMATNNGLGGAGVCWLCRILPIQALDDTGSGDTTTVGAAIRYATDRGANVINLSLGSSDSDPAMQSAVAYALDHGVSVVAAAGNSGPGSMLYPALYTGVISVGATTSSGSMASFSGTGPSLVVVAPGVSVSTTDWTHSNATSAYTTASGTSMSSAVVAGLTGILKSYRPAAVPAELTSALRNGGTVVNSSSGNFVQVAGQAALNNLNPSTHEAIYRLVGSRGDRLYTPSWAEARVALVHGYSFEGVGFVANSVTASGYVPVYRLFNLSAGQHYYTTSASEASNLASAGFSNEGITFYVASGAGSGLAAVYRLYNNGAGHLYTTSAPEATNAAFYGYSSEGIQFYVPDYAVAYRDFNTGNGEHFYTSSSIEARSGGLLPEGSGFIISPTAASGLVALYRLYSPVNHRHLYTIDVTERSAALAGGFLDEGILGYVSAAAGSGLEGISRLYSPISGDHFYTANAIEALAAQSLGYSNEGVPFWGL